MRCCDILKNYRLVAQCRTENKYLSHLASFIIQINLKATFLDVTIALLLQMSYCRVGLVGFARSQNLSPSTADFLCPLK
jgi:hypothetical protein